MRRSLQTRLIWGHAVLFLLASTVSILIGWAELERERSKEPDLKKSHFQLALVAAAVSCVPVLLLSGASWWLTRRCLAPIVALTEAAEHIHEGTLHRDLPLRGTGDELDRLTSVINDMTSRLDGSFQKVREFTLHASHELKTPLTILRNGFEKALADPSLPDRHRDQVFVWLDEVDRLNRIVSGLTLLTQGDAHLVTLNRETFDIGDIVTDIAGEADMLGQQQSLRVTTTIEKPCHVSGDRHLLRQLLLNLTDNAVKYNREGGHIHYAVHRESGSVIVEVESGGRGIDREELPQIFDRFFRSGTSRGTSHDGCGLGLSIALWIAQEHGGTLTATSRPDCTRLRLALPALR